MESGHLLGAGEVGRGGAEEGVSSVRGVGKRVVLSGERDMLVYHLSALVYGWLRGGRINVTLLRSWSRVTK